MGPEGTLGSRIILLQRLLSIAKENSNRNGNITQENQPRDNTRRFVEARAVNFVLPTKRLEHAAYAVAQVQTQESDCNDVKPGDPDIAKTNDHHFENIVALLRIFKGNEILPGEIDVLHLHCVMEEMIDDEKEN